MLEGICGKIAPGMCRLSAGGEIAVKTSAGYRTYNPEKRRLTNCDSFVLDIGEDFFFVLPTNHVRPGDIILAGGVPRCVVALRQSLMCENVLNLSHLFLVSKLLCSICNPSAWK